MAKVDRIEQIVQDENSDNPTNIQLLDEFKDALIGVYRIEEKAIPVYSYIRLIELAVEDGIDEETAVEWVDETYLSKPIQDFFFGRYIIVDDTGV